jgi:hypothetical protein
MTENESKPPRLDQKTLLGPMSVEADGQDLPFLGHPRAVNTVCITAVRGNFRGERASDLELA